MMDVYNGGEVRLEPEPEIEHQISAANLSTAS
jgi:hypothetical protein